MLSNIIADLSHLLFNRELSKARAGAQENPHTKDNKYCAHDQIPFCDYANSQYRRAGTKYSVSIPDTQKLFISTNCRLFRYF